MAQESCNLNKDETEILKPSSSSPTPAHKEEAAAEIMKPPPSSSSSSSPTSPKSSSSSPPPLFKEFSAKRTEPNPPPPVRLGNRCSSCRRKVGLTGFRCRCGDLFCGQHRYSDTHDCSFDYKALGRQQISKANPVIRAAKIIKI